MPERFRAPRQAAAGPHRLGDLGRRRAQGAVVDRLGGQLQAFEQGQPARHHRREGARHPRRVEVAHQPADHRNAQQHPVEAQADALVAKRPAEGEAERDEAEQDRPPPGREDMRDRRSPSGSGTAAPGRYPRTARRPAGRRRPSERRRRRRRRSRAPRDRRARSAPCFAPAPAARAVRRAAPGWPASVPEPSPAATIPR